MKFLNLKRYHHLYPFNPFYNKFDKVIVLKNLLQIIGLFTAGELKDTLTSDLL